MTKVKNYLRLYLEESILKGLDKEVLGLAEDLGRRIGDTFHDYSVLITYWEALFFSGHFEGKQKADHFFERHPSVAKYIRAEKQFNLKQFKEI